MLLAGVLSLLVVLGYQYVKLSRVIDRQTEAGPYPKIVDMHLAFSLPVSLGAKPHRVPSGAEAGEPGPNRGGLSGRRREPWVRATSFHTRGLRRAR